MRSGRGAEIGNDDTHALKGEAARHRCAQPSGAAGTRDDCDFLREFGVGADDRVSLRVWHHRDSVSRKSGLLAKAWNCDATLCISGVAMSLPNCRISFTRRISTYW